MKTVINPPTYDLPCALSSQCRPMFVSQNVLVIHFLRVAIYVVIQWYTAYVQVSYHSLVGLPLFPVYFRQSMVNPPKSNHSQKVKPHPYRLHHHYEYCRKSPWKPPESNLSLVDFSSKLLRVDVVPQRLILTRKARKDRELQRWMEVLIGQLPVLMQVFIGTSASQINEHEGIMDWLGQSARNSSLYHQIHWGVLDFPILGGD